MAIKEIINNQNKFWQFIQSGFGIWCLSTLLIPFFIFCFGNYKQHKAEQKERVTKISQLDLEIENRISQFWVHLYPLVNKKDNTFKTGISYDTVKVFWDAFKNPPIFNPTLVTTIYKEYETRTTVSLMIELSFLLKKECNILQTEKKRNKEQNKPTTIEPVKEKDTTKIEEINNIESAATFISSDGIFWNSDTPTIEDIWNSFVTKIIFDRWNNLFPYTDCLFC